MDWKVCRIKWWPIYGKSLYAYTYVGTCVCIPQSISLCTYVYMYSCTRSSALQGIYRQVCDEKAAMEKDVLSLRRTATPRLVYTYLRNAD